MLKPPSSKAQRALAVAALALGVLCNLDAQRLSLDFVEYKRFPADDCYAILRIKNRHKSAVEYFTVRDDQSVAFRLIPELAVMPRKRFWSGQITQGEILAVLKRYRPEQLLLDDKDLADAEIARFVSDNYTLVSQDAGLALYVVKGL